jgi:hypothetical protein
MFTMCHYADCRYAECCGANLLTTYIHYIANGDLSHIDDVKLRNQWLVV